MNLASNYNTFIFDFDGTIVDTLPLYLHCFNKVLKNFDQEPIGQQDIEGWFGLTELEIISKKIKKQSEIKAALEQLFYYYQANHDQFIQMSPEVIELLSYLKKEQKTIAVVTGKGRKTLTSSVSVLNIGEFIQYSVAGDEVKKPKPNAEGVHKILKMVKEEPEKTVYIGDADIDIQAAQNAGIDCIAAKWFCKDKKYLSTPTYTVYHPAEIWHKADAQRIKEIST